MAPESLQRWRGKGKDTRQIRREMSLFTEIRTKEDTTRRFCDRKNINRINVKKSLIGEEIGMDSANAEMFPVCATEPM